MEEDLQRIHLKILVDAPAGLSLDPFLAIFGRWRHDKNHPAEWVDLADYAHMAKGPGVMLGGKQCNFCVSTDDPGLGLLYAGKKDFEGPVENRVLEAFRRCIRLSQALAAEPQFPPEMTLNTQSWELFINDRLQFPNTDATDRLLRTPIQAALDELFGAGDYAMTRDTDNKRRYAFSIRAEKPETLNTLLGRADGFVQRYEAQKAAEEQARKGQEKSSRWF